MNELQGTMTSPREQLLERLRAFELAAKPLHPGYRGPSDLKERTARLQSAAEELRLFLSRHPASKELMEWGDLPDTDAETAAFAHELKLEHADLLRELGELVEAITKLELALDRHEASLQIHEQCRSLAQRVARHAGGEETQMGRYF